MTRIDNINSEYIKAGKPVKIWIGDHGADIFEIRYIYDKTVPIDTMSQVEQETTWSNFSKTEYTAAGLVDGYDNLRVYADSENPARYNEGNSIELLTAGKFTDGKPQANVLEFNPAVSGKIEINFTGGGTNSPRLLKIEQDGVVKAWRNSGDQLRRAVIEQSGEKKADKAVVNNALTDVIAEVKANETVSIYANPECTLSDGSVSKATGGIYFYEIDFTPVEGTDGVTFEHEGRVWTNIMFLNSGDYQRSIYSNLNVLTKDGFLYNVNLNGIQPYSFIFYANNRGFLYDRWGLYSDAEWQEHGVENTNAYLQPLE